LAFPDRGGYAGAAPSFAADDAHVVVDAPDALGSRFTIELWRSAIGWPLVLSSTRQVTRSSAAPTIVSVSMPKCS
jgi:hypothetical protein